MALVLLSPLFMRPQPVAAQLCGMQYVNGEDLYYGPCPNQNNNQPPQPQRDLYTAVAVSDKSLAFGYSYEATSRAQAEQMALSACRQRRGGSDCKLADWAENDCLGVALSHRDGTWAVASGSNPFLAANAAVQTCRKDGGKACAVAATPCSGAPPIPFPGTESGIQVRR